MGAVNNDPDDKWHIPRPGPVYWDHLCLTCDKPVDEHPSIWQRIKYRLFGVA